MARHSDIGLKFLDWAVELAEVTYTQLVKLQLIFMGR